MNPFIMLMLAILSPFLMTATLLVPPYAGITAASYIIYNKGTAINPLTDKLFDVFYIVDVYTALFSQWSQHMAQTSLLTYTLPLLLPPLVGIVLSFWLIRKVATKLKNIFHGGLSY